jgi:hypothetical protein
VSSRQIETLSHRRPLRFWGWGYADQELTSEEVSSIRAMASRVAPTQSLEDDRVRSCTRVHATSLRTRASR